MQLTEISQQARKLGLTAFDIEFTKVIFNGYEVKILNKDKTEQIEKLKEFILDIEYNEEIKEMKPLIKLPINQIDL